MYYYLVSFYALDIDGNWNYHCYRQDSFGELARQIERLNMPNPTGRETVRDIYVSTHENEETT
jgi:hypothetical protein